MNNRFERLELLIGKEKLNELKNKRVVILGLGGVGGYAVEALARCGISSFLLIDSDTIDETNINRQIIATNKTIGNSKAEAWKERVHDINSDAKVEILEEFIDENNFKKIFKGKVDFFIDCCDTVKTKELVIKYALLNNINIISSMGAGARFNPEDLEIIEIKKTSYDPIAKKIRNFLKDEKINKKLMVMCSHEKPVKVVSSIPSNSFVPSSAGLLIASYVFKKLINYK